MRRTDALWEVFVVRFEDALERYRKRRLTGEEAGELGSLAAFSSSDGPSIRRKAGKGWAIGGLARFRRAERGRGNWRACRSSIASSMATSR